MLFRHLYIGTMLLVCGLVAASPTGYAVDDDRLINAHADSTNWLTYGHGYSNQRYSELDEINRDNIKKLAPRWIYQTGTQCTFQSNVQRCDDCGIIDPEYSIDRALDAATG